MKLAALYFDDVVVVPGHVSISGGTSQHREQAFIAVEGWDLELVEPGVFRVMREGMPAPVVVGGFGYSYVAAEHPGEPGETKRKRHAGKPG